MNASRNIIFTEDGSHTIAIAENITYHSKYGAMQESLHVFVQSGLQYFIEADAQHQSEPVKIFEMGFGTGLNALLSLHYALQHNKKINYQTIEAYPLSTEEVLQLNYTDLPLKNLKQSFYSMHKYEWDKLVELHPLFSFKKIKSSLENFESSEQFHLIYFDAFDPNTQPGLWTEAIFKKMYSLLYANGILVTYCSKGSVQRALKAAGFRLEKIKGPPGKREIIRALKLNQY